MKTNRQSKIIEIIQKNEVETQDELSALLEKDGFRVTQATVSRDIRELKPEESVYRELALIKVSVSAEKRQDVIAITNIFRANIIDVGQESLIVEITGNQSKVDACINLLSNYEILELARTGIAGLGRGTGNVVYLDPLD